MLGKDIKEEGVFAESEPFNLFGVNLFTAELNKEKGPYSKDDIENLIVTAKKLIGTSWAQFVAILPKHEEYTLLIFQHFQIAVLYIN